MTDYIIPLLLAGVALFALGRRENVYEELLTGAAGGLKLLVSIVPALIALLTAVHMLRASGAMEAAASFLAGDCGTGSGAAHQRQRRSGSRGGLNGPVWPGQSHRANCGHHAGQYGDNLLHHQRLLWRRRCAPDPICRPCSAFGRSHRLLHGFPHRPVVFLKFSLYFSPRIWYSERHENSK